MSKTCKKVRPILTKIKNLMLTYFWQPTFSQIRRAPSIGGCINKLTHMSHKSNMNEDECKFICLAQKRVFISYNVHF
jgi:hypothetical protein